MKKAIALILIISLVLGLTACAATEASTNADDPDNLPDEAVAYDQNDLRAAIADLPDENALDAIWSRLDGNWAASEESFDGLNEDGSHKSMYWASLEFFHYKTDSFILELSIYGHSIQYSLIDAYATSEYEATLIFLIPATHDDGADATATIHIDLTGISKFNAYAIRIMIDADTIHGDGEWRVYSRR